MSKTVVGYRKGRPPKYQVDWDNLAVGKEVQIPVNNGNARTIQTAVTSAALRHGLTVSCSTSIREGFVFMRRIK